MTTTGEGGETTTTSGSADTNSNAASNPIVDDGSIDPALMWGLIGGGICLFLLLLLLCIVCLVRRRNKDEQTPKDYDNVDLAVMEGENANARDSATAYLAADELDSPAKDKEPAIYQSTSALVKAPSASSGIVYSAFKETNASMAQSSSVAVDDIDDDDQSA
jgi:hypothetical protein